MIDIVGDDSRQCADIVRELCVHVLNDWRAVELLQGALGLLGARSTKGVWVVSMEVTEAGLFRRSSLIDALLLRGASVATQLAAQCKQLTSASGAKLLGVDWKEACHFLTLEQAQEVADKMTKCVNKDGVVAFQVDRHTAPLARLIAAGQWTQLEQLMRSYEPNDPAHVVVVGVLQPDTSVIKAGTESMCSRYYIRTLVCRYGAPTSYTDEGQWQHGQLVSLLIEYTLHATAVCRRHKKDVRTVDELLTNEFVRMVASNTHLNPVCVASMRRMVMDDALVSECVVCGASNASFRCAQCRLYRYCGDECQRAHWTGHTPTASLSPQLPHKHVCMSMRAFSIVLSQTSTVDDAMFAKLCKLAASVVHHSLQSAVLSEYPVDAELNESAPK